MNTKKEITVTPEEIHSMGPRPAIIMAGLRMCEGQIGSVDDVYINLSRCVKEQTVRNCLNKLVDMNLVRLSERVDDNIHTTFLYCEKGGASDDVPDI